MIVDRRKMLLASAAGMAAALPSVKAWAKLTMDLEPRGTIGRLERLPTLDLESQQGFFTEFRVWVNRRMVRAAEQRSIEVLKAAGIDPQAELPREQVIKMFENDPMMTMHTLAWESSQRQMWASIQDAYHAEKDKYLEEMEKAEKVGPGTLELDPKMAIPEYTAHEIHLQPGGYVGDPFAGHIYLHGQNVVFNGGNFQDNSQLMYAAAVPTPKDGKVRRIHEPGCSIGQLTQALKERFPEAEVWGTDIGAPMIRFAHLRSADMGVDVNYAQRLAEDTKFPDNHFDIVVDNLLQHEMTREAILAMYRETFRTLRPGGVYYAIDLHTGSPKPRTAFQKFQAWRDHRWNHEIWRYEYESVDMPAELRKAGFEVVERGPPARRGTDYNILATKPA
ncbi:MAG: methyltransferase domain-containing protein [Rhodospirillaceae bacterium]|nr:methyltransferase domain-containing protein [Rhodospirillaceae bacterium]